MTAEAELAVAIHFRRLYKIQLGKELAGWLGRTIVRQRQLHAVPAGPRRRCDNISRSDEWLMTF